MQFVVKNVVHCNKVNVCKLKNRQRQNPVNEIMKIRITVLGHEIV